MLTIVKLLSHQGKKEFWEAFDPNQEVWIVSDLKAKLYLKADLLEKHAIIQNEPIKRASEFWTELLKTTLPDYSTLNSLGQWLMAKKFLDHYEHWIWSRRPRAADSLLNTSRQLALFISHDAAQDIFDQFTQEFKPNSFFKEITQASIDFYKFCYSKKKIPNYFVPQILFKEAKEFPQFKKIYFDLNAEFLESEKDAIQTLSKNTEVVVFIPDQIEKINKAYATLSLGLSSVKTIERGERSQPEIKLWKCASPAAEARKAVEYVADLVRKENISPSDICITSKDISHFENILYHDLSWEGIGINRKLSSPASSLDFFRVLSAKLQIISGNWDWLTLSEAFPYLNSVQKKLLKPVIKTEQIFIDHLKEDVSLLESKCPSGKIAFSDFEKILNDVFQKMSLEINEQILSKTLSMIHKIKNQGEPEEFEYKIWLEAWLKTCASTDFIYAEPDPNGVKAVDFRSLDEINVKYLIILGLQTEGKSKNIIGDIDLNALKFFQDQGFDFDKQNHDWSENLKWYLSGKYKKVVLSYATEDSQAAVQSASPLWIQWAQKTQKTNMDSIDKTTWSEFQNNILDAKNLAYLSQLKKWEPEKTEKFVQQITKDTSAKAVVEVKLSDVTLSSSSLEQYWNCPFKFLASVGFALSDEEGLEVEPTPAVKGQILHRCAEEILKSEDLKYWTEDKLINLLDQEGKNQKKATSDVWPSTRKRLLRQLIRFVDFEKNWKLLFPLSQNGLFEHKVSGFINWDNKAKKLKFSKETGKYKWKGRIDRIDLNAQGDAVLIDYKDKSSGLTSIKSWAKTGQFQLLLYSESLKAGLGNVKIKNVLGAFYYSLRNLDRQRGFLRTDLNTSGFLPEELPKNTKVDEKSYNNYLNEIFQVVGGCMEKIEANEFNPQPVKEAICDTCSWNKLCRAKHLL